MAILRFHRDKRGYEYFSLVEPGKRRGRSGRVLYWYRTPPNVKLGRTPFDDAVQRALEARYPGIHFDWPSILATPIPSVEDEMWRERRRAAKAAKRVAAEEVSESDADEAAPEGPRNEPSAGEAGARLTPNGETVVDGEASREDEVPTDPREGASKEQTSEGASARHRRRRRRRRGGGGQQSAPPGGL